MIKSIQFMRQLLEFVSMLFIIALPVRQATAQSVADIIDQAGIVSGICLVVGCGDGDVALQAYAQGKILVVGLEKNADLVRAAKKKIVQQGLGGLISVIRLADYRALPFKDNVCNVVIADNATLGSNAPSADELKRVIAPNGILIQKNGGAWQAAVKERAAGLDNWTHWNKDCDGNGISKDQFAGFPTGFQWIGSRYGRGTLAHFRVWNGLVAALEDTAKTSQVLTVRDAFNGTLLWMKSTSLRDADLILANGKVYTQTKSNDYMAAFDAKTGVQIVKYTEGALHSDTISRIKVYYPGYGVAMQFVVSGKTLIQAAGRNLFALDEATGKRLWSYSHNNLYLGMPIIDTVGGRIFLLEGNNPVWSGPRWAYMGSLVNITALSLADGKPLWVKTAPSTFLNRLVYSNGKVAFVHMAGIFGHPDNTDTPKAIGAVNASTGELTWINRDNSFYSVAINDGKVYGLSSGIKTFDINTGALLTTFSSPNQGCMKPVMINKMVVFGHLGFVDDEKGANLRYTALTRAACATGVFPANGLIYAATNSWCACIVDIRAQQAFSCDKNPATPVADDRRLEKEGMGAFSSADAASFLRLTLKTPLIADWQRGLYGNYAGVTRPAFSVVDITPALTVGDLSIAAVTHEHRLEAKRNGQLVWSFVADARIASAPILYQGRIYFSSRDGYVYCVNPADGALHWRFLAARADRRIAICGQVESVWPATNPVIFDKLLYVAAGLNTELDSGTAVYGLDPASGAISNQFRLLSMPQNKAQSVPNVKQPGVVTQFLQASESSLTLCSEFSGSKGVSVRSRQLLPSQWKNQTIDLVTTAPTQIISDFPNVQSGNGAKGLALGNGWFHLDKTGPVRLAVYSISGKLQKVLFDGQASMGTTNYGMTGADFPAGNYIITLKTATGSASQRMSIIRR